MEIKLVQNLVSIITILLGFYFIRKHHKLGCEVAEFNRNRMLPLKKATAKEYSIVHLVCGIILCLVGALSLLGLIRWKN